MGNEELEVQIAALKLELEEARKGWRESAALAGLHATARMRADAAASDAVRAGARTVIAWLRQAHHLRVQVGRMLVGEIIVRAVVRELADHVEARLRASEEETLRTLPDSGD